MDADDALRRASVGPTVLAIAAVSVVAAALRVFGPVDVVMLYLLAVVVIASRYGARASVLALALSVAAFDFFCVEPTMTFTVADARYVFTFATMFIVGLVISGLTGRLRREEVEARHREARTRSLLGVARASASERTREGVAWMLAHECADTLRRPVAVLLADDHGALLPVATIGLAEVTGAEEALARWVLAHGRPAGRGTATLEQASILGVPLVGAGGAVGVVVVAGEGAIDIDQRDLLDAFARQAAVVLERISLEAEAKIMAAARQTEQVRAALLSAVSHDLRTPLAAITGAATTLRHSGARLSDVDRNALLDDIAADAIELERLVEDLLDMGRVESGALTLRREAQALEELVGATLDRCRRSLEGRVVSVDVDSALEVDVDAVLIVRVLVNLLENAARHTPPGAPVDLVAFVKDDGGGDGDDGAKGDTVVLEIGDRGPGMQTGLDAFSPFVRGTSFRGAGLGSAICRGFVEAHTGTLTLRPRDGGGMIASVSLPHAATPTTAPGALP